MIKKTFLFLGLGLVILFAVLLFNMFGNKPWPINKIAPSIAISDSAISHMQQAIRIKTVTPTDTLHTDTATYTAFRLFLERSYPFIHQQLKRTLITQFNYVFEWKGRDTSLAPIVLMGHYDVVPVEASAIKLWTAEPFGGEVKNNAIWGRGSIDDKGNVISILEATEALLKTGFVPKQTILLCFGSNEESSGQGARAIVRFLDEKHIRPSMVVDEGGAITRNKFKDVNRPIAVIGVAEKGYVTFELAVEKPGGHSSQPADETSIDILSKALYKLRAVSTESTLLPATRTFLTRMSASSSSFTQRLATSNLWLLEGLVKGGMAKSPSGNAMIRTTIVPTMLNSGVRENVIPTNATAIVNSRILPGDTRKSVEDFIRKIINDDRVTITVKGDFSSEPSSITDINTVAYQRVEQAINAVVDSVITTPYIVLGGTDSRYYRQISNGIVNFTPETDPAGYHGIDERLPVPDYIKCINFYTVLIKQ
jgi:carboxypeptidase PM20D1